MNFALPSYKSYSVQKTLKVKFWFPREPFLSLLHRNHLSLISVNHLLTVISPAEEFMPNHVICFCVCVYACVYIYSIDTLYSKRLTFHLGILLM